MQIVARTSCLREQQATRLTASETPDKMSGGPQPETAAPRDLTPGDHDVPPFSSRWAGHVCDFAGRSGARLHQRTSTKSKRPARTTKFFIVPIASGNRQSGSDRKFPPVPAATRRRSIRRTENTSPGDRKPAPASKPINGGCFVQDRQSRADPRYNGEVRARSVVSHVGDSCVVRWMMDSVHLGRASTVIMSLSSRLNQRVLQI